MSTIIRIAREPLIHFLLLGAAIFAVFLVLEDRESRSAPELIQVTAQDADRLSSGFRAVWRRPPTEEELAGLIDDHIREEVFVREALNLSLDRDDTVIRRRLRQKMEFLLESAAGALGPTEEELRDHLDTNAERFATQAKVAFQQVYLGEASNDADVEWVRNELESGTEPAELGRRTLLPMEMPLSPASVIDGTFGTGFFASIKTLEEDRWSGPISSGYGSHLVRLTAQVEAELPPLESIRDQVVSDWRRQKAEELSEAQVRRLLERYEVVRPSLSDSAANAK